MNALCGPRPLRTAYRTDERAVGQALTVGEKDLCAATIDVGLVTVGPTMPVNKPHGVVPWQAGGSTIPADGA